MAAFTLRGPREVFTPANLTSHIDGAAEAMVRQGFRQCVYGEYAPAGKGANLITADVYRMDSVLDAYGVYTSQRDPAAPVVKIGGDGYKEATALNFWRGPYYVQIALLAPHPPEVFKVAMLRIARAIAARLSGPTAPPAMIGLLPPGCAPRTEQYMRVDIAAQKYLKNGVIGRYPVAGRAAELFIAEYPTPTSAILAFNEYRVFLSRPFGLAAKSRPMLVSGLGDRAIAVKTRFTGQVVAAAQGRYVVGVRRATSEPAALKLAKEAVSRIR